MHRTLSNVVWILLTVFWLGPARAQLQSPPIPTPEITKLNELLLGTWRTTEQHEKSSLISMGGRGTGLQTFRAGPGGFTLIVDNRSQNGAFAFSGHGVICWDAKENVYKSFWFDTTQSAADVQRGRWEDGNLVFRGESEFMGKRTTFKLVYTDFHPNSFTFYTESSVDQGPSQRMMTIHFARTSSLKDTAK